MPPRGLSRAATLPNIPVDRSFEEKAKLRKSLAHISSRSLARSLSKIDVESTQPRPAKAAAATALPVIPESESGSLSESPYVDVLNGDLTSLLGLTDLTTADFEAYQHSDEYNVQRQLDRLKRESLLQRWEAEEKRLAESGAGEEASDLQCMHRMTLTIEDLPVYG